MKIETKLKRIQALSEGLNLINQKDYTKKYFSTEDRARADYYFKKNNLITIGGSVFIIDVKPEIKK